jgi:multiple sugar transport system permease protein
MFLTYAGIVVVLLFFLMPFAWILTTSLKGNEDYFSFPPVWIPPEPSLVHYQSLFTRGNGWLYFKNSLAISTMSMFVALCFSVPTAYSIARFRFGGSLFSNFLLLLRTMPAIALVLPIYVLYSNRAYQPTSG